MTAERILQSDVLDILFEGKNKLYGAYQLRRTYNQRLKKAIGGMFILISLGAAGYLFASRQNVNPDENGDYENSLVIADLTQPKKLPTEKPKAEPQPLTQKKTATVKDFVPIIKPDEQVPNTEVPDVTQVDTAAVGTENKSGDAVASGDNTPVGSVEGKSGGTGSEPAVTEPALPTGPVEMYSVDEMPQYPGGMQALVRYMVNNLTSELEPGVKYVLKAQFVINEEGSVSDAVILNSDDASLNQQVLKALRKMKAWKPGRIRGHNVAVRFIMPVTFVGPEE